MMDKPHLSPRQLECLWFIALGRTSTEIAQELGLKRRTVDEVARRIPFHGHQFTLCDGLDGVGMKDSVADAARHSHAWMDDPV